MSNPQDEPTPTFLSDTPPPPTSSTPSNTSSLPIPIIAGAGGGGLVLIVIAITTWCVVRKRRRPRSPKDLSSSSIDIEKQQLDSENFNPESSGHDPHPDKSTKTSMEHSRKVHKMYTPPKTPTSPHTRQPSVPNVYASPRHSTSLPTFPPSDKDTTNTTSSPTIPPRRQSRSATISSATSARVTFVQFSDLASSSPSSTIPQPVHIDSVQIDMDNGLPTTTIDEILLQSGATNNTGVHTLHSGPLPDLSKAKRELLQQRQQMKRSPSFSMSNVPFPLAPLPPIPVTSNPTSPTLSPTMTPSASPTPPPLSSPPSSHRNSPALVPRSSLRRESRDNRKSLMLQLSPPPPPPMVPIPAPPQEKLPRPPSQLAPPRRNPAFTHQRRASSRGQELDEIVRQVREEDSKVEALYASGQVPNLGTTCSRSTRTSLQQQSSVNISLGDDHSQQYPFQGNNGSNSSSTNGHALRAKMGPSHHYMPDEHQPPVASPPLPASHSLTAAVQAAAVAAAAASTMANRISTASHRLSKHNNASSPNLKLQAAEFNKEQPVSVREQARPRSRSFSSTLVPASLPASPSSSPTPESTARSSSSSPSGLASLPQHLQAPRPLLQQAQYSFLPSSSTMVSGSSVTATTPTSPPPSVVGLGISNQLTQLDQHLPPSSPPPSSPPCLRRQPSFSQLNGVQLPSAHIPAQWRGRFAPEVEKYGGSTPRVKPSSISSSARSPSSDLPSPTMMSLPLHMDDNHTAAIVGRQSLQGPSRRHSSSSRHGTSNTSSGSASPLVSWEGLQDELPSQTKERLLRHAAATLQALPEVPSSPASEDPQPQLPSHYLSRVPSVSSMSDSNASMSTPPSRTFAQHDHHHLYGQGRHGGLRGEYDRSEDESGGEGDNGEDEELRRIIEDAIKIASTKAAAARASRASMNGLSLDSRHYDHRHHHHEHAYQLRDSPSTTVN